MAYFQPYIDDTGFHIPTYVDIRDDLITQCKNIFGQDLYLGEDTQDYQWIAVNAEKIYHAFLAAQLAYNNRGPSTSIGTGLDGIVKINGIKRKSATYSTTYANVIGIPGAIIENAIALDKGNIKWDLPSSIIIPASGIVENLLLTCEVPGPIAASPGDIIQMFNPQYGWNGVINTDSAKLGSYVEDDAKLRLRQSNSTANPSKTMLEGTKGAIAQITGVTRYKVYENDENEPDSNGLPPHSITCVVEGGNDEEIANAIYIHKGVGCKANGTTIVDVLDKFGDPTSIGFFRPSYVDIAITVNVKQLTDYTSATTDAIKKNIQDYLNSMQINNNLLISSLWGVSLSAMPSLVNPMFSVLSIEASRLGQPQGTQDLVLAFNEVCRGSINNITVNVS